MIDCDSIIFGIIGHYEHSFHVPNKALLTYFALLASFAAQNCHLLIVQPFSLSANCRIHGPKGSDPGVFPLVLMHIRSPCSCAYGSITGLVTQRGVRVLQCC